MEITTVASKCKGKDKKLKKLILTVFPFLIIISCSDNLIIKGNENLSLGDYQRAVYLFSRAVDKNPKSFEARLGLGKALMQQLTAVPGHDEVWNACLTNLEAARTLNPGAEVDKILSSAWHQWAVNFIENRDTTRALKSLLKSIEYDKNNPKAMNLAGILYFNLGDYQKAFSLFTVVMHLDTLSPTGYFNAGVVAWSEGNCETSESLWMNALRRFPDNKELLYCAAIAKKKCAGEK